MLSNLALTLLPLFPLAFATNHPVTVGADAKLVFNPPNIKAAIGDTLTFSFFPKNHSVVQSNFANPCKPLANGFNSGFQPLAAGPGPVDFVVTVKDTKPIWVYCAQTKGSHCQTGMNMVVNEPAPPSPNTLDAYRVLAAMSGNSTAPSHVSGGVFVNRNATGISPSATGTASGGVPSSTGTASVRVPSSTCSNVKRSTGSGSNGDSSTSGTSTGPNTSETSPIAFEGAASKLASGSTVALISSLLFVLASIGI